MKQKVTKKQFLQTLADEYCYSTDVLNIAYDIMINVMKDMLTDKLLDRFLAENSVLYHIKNQYSILLRKNIMSDTSNENKLLRKFMDVSKENMEYMVTHERLLEKVASATCQDIETVQSIYHALCDTQDAIWNAKKSSKKLQNYRAKSNKQFLTYVTDEIQKVSDEIDSIQSIHQNLQKKMIAQNAKMTIDLLQSDEIREYVHQNMQDKYAETNCNLEMLTQAYQLIIDGIQKTVCSGKELSLSGFGSFYLRKHKGHPVQFDSGTTKVNDYVVLKFSASDVLAQKIRQAYADGEVILKENQDKKS